MGGHKTISGSSYPTPAGPPPPPTPDYNVEGPLTPDSTCNYYISGIYNGKPYAKRADSEWFIWGALLTDVWTISKVLGVLGISYWIREEESITGEYLPAGEAFGIATVAAGGH